MLQALSTGISPGVWRVLCFSLPSPVSLFIRQRHGTSKVARPSSFFHIFSTPDNVLALRS